MTNLEKLPVTVITGFLGSGKTTLIRNLLDRLPDSVIEDYVESMERLLELAVDDVHPGHYRSFDRSTLRRLTRAYIDSQKAPRCPADKPPA